MPTKTPISAAELLDIVEAFPWKDWNTRLATTVANVYRDVVVTQGTAAADDVGGEFSFDDPFVSRFATKYVGERIVQLDETTKEELSALLVNVLDDHDTLTVGELGDKIQAAVGEKFEGYAGWRADRIARTETAIAYNHANVLGWAQGGVEEVEVQDGTGDDICAAANGQTWDLRKALEDPIGHPNCERTLTPVVTDAEARAGARERLAASLDAEEVAVRCASSAARIAEREDPNVARAAAQDGEDEDDETDA